MEISSELIGVIVGALIAGFFALVQAFKNNNLQYVTKERSQWRDKIRKLMKDIDKSDYENIHYVLTDLKGNINAYGMHPSGSYPEDCMLDYQKDEHIRKIIDKIENCQSSDEYKVLRKRLVEYLALLLKFEWERHKLEVKGNNYILKSIGVFLIPYIFTFFYKIAYVNLSSITNIIQSIHNTNLYKTFFIQLGIYIIYLLISLSVGNLNNYRKWYKYQCYAIWFVIITSLAVIINILSFNDKINYNIFNYIKTLPQIILFVLFLILSYCLVLISTIETKKLYFDYDLSIRRVFFDKKIYLYYKPKYIVESFFEMFRMIKIDNVFNKYNVSIIEEKLKADLKIEFKNKDIYFFEGVRFEQKKYEELINEKIVLKYQNDNKIYICCTTDKEDWEKFLKNIYENKL